MKKFTQSVFFICTLLFVTSSLAAQQPPPGPPPPVGLPPVEDNSNNAGVPLDGGIAIFILGTAAFGIKKLRDNNKK